MLHPLKQVRDHQNPLADPPALEAPKRRSSAAPGSLRKKYAGIVHPLNMVRLPSHSTISGDHRKPVSVAGKEPRLLVQARKIFLLRECDQYRRPLDLWNALQGRKDPTRGGGAPPFLRSAHLECPSSV